MSTFVFSYEMTTSLAWCNRPRHISLIKLHVCTICMNQSRALQWEISIEIEGRQWARYTSDMNSFASVGFVDMCKSQRWTFVSIIGENEKPRWVSTKKTYRQTDRQRQSHSLARYTAVKRMCLISNAIVDMNRERTQRNKSVFCISFFPTLRQWYCPYECSSADRS